MLAEPTASRGLTVLSQLYGFAGHAARFAVDHIDTLKQADNELANRCGQVLEAANIGFGVGSETALVLIGIGQNLLGNPLTGAVALPLASNPIVLTCAAIGAIHYGWKAMRENERTLLLRAVGKAFDVGAEFVRSIASFAFDTIQALIAKSSDHLKQLRDEVARVAEVFGRRLSDITHVLSDRLWEHAQLVYAGVGSVAATARSYVPDLRNGKGRMAGDVADGLDEPGS